MLEDMSVFDWITQLGHQSPAARTLLFAIWMLLGLFLFYGSPLFAPKGSRANTGIPSPADPPVTGVHLDASNSDVRNVITTPVKVEQSDIGNFVSAPTEATHSRVENVVTAPTSLRQISNTSSGSVQTTAGNNFQAPKEIATGIFIQPVGGTTIINIDNGVTFHKKAIKVKTNKGGATEIQIYTLFDSASWAYRSSSKLLSFKDKDVSLERFLDSQDFSADAESYQAIVCLGLASGVARGELARTVRFPMSGQPISAAWFPGRYRRYHPKLRSLACRWGIIRIQV